MTPYRFCTLYSGSTGNCTYLETPTARILIDAGRCTRTLIQSLSAIGVDVDSLDAIFITHEHTDHVAALEVLAKKHPVPVHMTLKSAMRYRANPPKELCECLQLHDATDFSVSVGDLTVTAFPVSHDSRCAVGYRITGPDDFCVGLATDVGVVTPSVENGLAGCEAVVLESNHDVDMLWEGPYPYELKTRILSRQGHLSNEDSATFAAKLAGSGTRHILLAHLSEQNNLPDLAYCTAKGALAGTSTHIEVASPVEVTMLVGKMDAPVPKQIRTAEVTPC